ncbi:transcriptional regulatory protein cssR [Desulfocucumis palustris]|uniref:Stage 0 sporulation protein A homolog n=1 Tax=Desulfocucumis palustris TaxID=1898651 RepID=A0A2L2XJ20_9FIRM|nr:response regulator transcription factor [Desulfocucumis palustris]GBF35703.1 transcriptional regulatory protein cssR [Desulfocucumis palustris]
MEYVIYLVEDEPNLNELLTAYLQKEGWRVRSFLDGGEARSAIGSPPHLWILDIMLPGVDGYQLIREIKAVSPRLPVIFISARDADIDRIVGLEMGSDDYLPKPFMPRELVIRAKKLLDRVYESPANDSDSAREKVIGLSCYNMDEQARQVFDSRGTPVELTAKEFELLLYFAKNRGQILGREQLLVGVWGNEFFGTDRVVDDLVRRIRKKMPDLRLETIYGYGYRLVKA